MSRDRGAGRSRRGEQDGYGPGANGGYGRPARRGAVGVDETGDVLPGGRTAVRDHADDFWAGEPTARGLRSRVAERPGVRRGSPGGGRGGPGGPGGGGRRQFDPRSPGERFKDWLLEGSWWRHWTWKKVLAVLGGGIAAVILLAIGAVFYLYQRTPIPTAHDMTANYQSSTVYYANGKPMGTFNDTVNGTVIDRVLLTPSEIPKDMTDAMTGAEDRHFYTEGGVSFTGLVRSAYEDIFGSGNLQGGSTITMQYAKNYYAGVNTGQNYTTKLKEIFIAEKLARVKTKQWVMTNYLNTVPFGPTVDGLGAAAYNYFSVDLTKPHTTLTISQAAMLAAMPNAPGAFSPDPRAGADYTALVHRWKYVIGNMVRDGSITQAQASQAKFPKYNPPPAGNGETGTTAYLMNMVEQQLEAPKADGGYGLSQQQVDTGGYRITTTFSPAKMKALARSVSQAKALMRQDAQQQGMSSYQNYDRIGAAVEDSKTGAIVAIYGGPGWPSSSSKRATKRCAQANCYLNTAEDAVQVGSSFKPYVLATAVKQDMSVFTSKLDGFAPIWIPQSGPNAATTLSTNQHPPAGIQASAVGGYPPGSQVYWYKFAEAGENSGPLSVQAATATSSDPAFEDLLHRTGVDPVISMAKNFGVGQTAFVNPCGAAPNAPVPQTIAACNDMTGHNYKSGGTWFKGNGLQVNFSPESKNRGSVNTPGSLQMALGQNPLTPIEQASTFATLADDGMYHTPHVIASLQKNGVPVTSTLPAPRRVLTPTQAANTDWALSWDNRFPGATADVSVGNFRPGDVIAKTGTLGNGSVSSEAWFIGATPNQYAMAVALFTNLQSQTLDQLPAISTSSGVYAGSFGGAWPATIWDTYMTRVMAKAPYIPLFQTSNAGFIPWIQVHQQTKPICKFGHGNGNGNGQGQGQQNCVCPKGAQFCGQPNPGPSCQGGFGQPCGGNNPSPSPSCQVFGVPCNSSSSSPTPSNSPSPSGSTCTPAPGQPCPGNTTAAKVSRK